MNIHKRIENLPCIDKQFSKKLPKSAGFGTGRLIRVNVRYDDKCENGHKDFSITADIFRPGSKDFDAYCCMHSEIVKYFPAFKEYIPYHLVSSDGPLYYMESTKYWAECGDIKAARRAAIWPCATREQLCDKIEMRAHLKSLMLDFEKLLIKLQEMPGQDHEDTFYQY